MGAKFSVYYYEVPIYVATDVLRLYNLLKQNTIEAPFIKDRTPEDYNKLFKTSITVVASVGDEFVGVCFLSIKEISGTFKSHIPEDMHEKMSVFSSTMVNPAYRGKCYSRKFAKIRFEEAKRLGIEHLFASIHSDNIRNTKFIKLMGFDDYKPFVKGRNLFYKSIADATHV